MSEKKVEKAKKTLREMLEMIKPLTKPMKMGFPEINEQWKTSFGIGYPYGTPPQKD